jgi:hypothetical protein
MSAPRSSVSVQPSIWEPRSFGDVGNYDPDPYDFALEMDRVVDRQPVALVPRVGCEIPRGLHVEDILVVRE